MAGFLTTAFVVGTIAAGIRLTAPILLAALGEIYSELTGILNLGLEGIMEAGAFLGFWITFVTGSLWMGIIITMPLCGLIALIHGFLTVRVGVNQIISGLLIVMLGQGIAYFGYRAVFGAYTPSIPTFERLSVPLLSQIPVIGSLFNQNILVYLAFFLALIFGFVLYETKWGLHIRSTGENPRVSDELGVPVFRYRHFGVLISGIMAGLGGCFLTLGYTGLYGEGIVSGRGWIAIIAVVLSGWNPYKAIHSSFLFGLLYAVASRITGAGIGIPSELIRTIPYFLALVAIPFLYKRGAPAGLLQPYRRE